MSWFGDLGSVVGTLSASVTEALAGLEDDIKEFVDTVKTDTSETVQDTVAAVKEATDEDGLSLKSLSGAVEGVAANIGSGLREDGTSTDRRRKRSDPLGTVSYDRAEAQLIAIQRDRNTYLSDPEGDPVEYTEWTEGCDLNERTEEITKLLSTDDVIRKLHSELVPKKISYNVFWHRYFYSLHRLKAAGDRRQELVRAFEEDVDDQLEFDDDWGDGGDDDDDDGGGGGGGGGGGTEATGAIDAIDAIDARPNEGTGAADGGSGTATAAEKREPAPGCAETPPAAFSEPEAGESSEKETCAMEGGLGAARSERSAPGASAAREDAASDDAPTLQGAVGESANNADAAVEQDAADAESNKVCFDREHEEPTEGAKQGDEEPEVTVQRGDEEPKGGVEQEHEEPEAAVVQEGARTEGESPAAAKEAGATQAVAATPDAATAEAGTRPEPAEDAEDEHDDDGDWDSWE